MNTVQEYITLLETDSLLKGKIYLPKGMRVAFMNLPCILWEENHKLGFPDYDSAMLRLYIESKCGMLSRRNLRDALIIVLGRNATNLQHLKT